jgi:hypothetical protein
LLIGADARTDSRGRATEKWPRAMPRPGRGVAVMEAACCFKRARRLRRSSATPALSMTGTERTNSWWTGD